MRSCSEFLSQSQHSSDARAREAGGGDGEAGTDFVISEMMASYLEHEPPLARVLAGRAAQVAHPDRRRRPVGVEVLLDDLGAPHARVLAALERLAVDLARDDDIRVRLRERAPVLLVEVAPAQLEG